MACELEQVEVLCGYPLSFSLSFFFFLSPTFRLGLISVKKRKCPLEKEAYRFREISNFLGISLFGVRTPSNSLRQFFAFQHFCAVGYDDARRNRLSYG